MRTSLTTTELVIIKRALRHYGELSREERQENTYCDEIRALASHIEIIEGAASINTGETIIEVKKP